MLNSKIQPAELLQNLIRFNTTNPPGNEAECIAYIDSLLTGLGFQTTILAKDPNRPNLVTRLAGVGQAPPLLLYGHVDVVTAEKQDWQQPPFAGRLVDGYIWGRGALDMKGGLAMLLAACMRAKAEGTTLPGDVILAIVSDEENGGSYGAKFLVENHEHLFDQVRYAIGEFGGFSFQIGGQRFYPIMVAEKQFCWLKATFRGPAGHGSLPARGGAMAKLAGFLRQLDRRRLPVHITPVARQMFTMMAAALPFPTGLLLRQLLNPKLTDPILNLLGQRGQTFDPILHNTVNATIVQGGGQINVIPAEITVDLDGRLLPGYRPEDMLAELRQIAGSEAEFEVIRYDPAPAEPDMGLFDTLSRILREADPAGIPTPLLLSGVTDGRFFSRLGIQTYGFLPMPLPDELNFTHLIHAANERIPVDALTFGANALHQLLQRFDNGMS